MTSCTVDETKDRVVIKYLNGKSYEYKGWAVDCCVEWSLKGMTLLRPDGMHNGQKFNSVIQHVFLTDDTLCVESWHSDSVTIWKNPKYKLSVKTDVMTAKQRAKRNQAKKGRTQHLIEIYYEEGFSDAMEQLGYIHVGNIGDDTDE